MIISLPPTRIVEEPVTLAAPSRDRETLLFFAGYFAIVEDDE